LIPGKLAAGFKRQSKKSVKPIPRGPGINGRFGEPGASLAARLCGGEACRPR
jgi:hypothetical protein